MAKPLKEAGISEIEEFEKRVRRQHMLKRISDDDTGAMLRFTQALKDYIKEMEEKE